MKIYNLKTLTFDMKSVIISDGCKITLRNNVLTIGETQYRPNEIDFTDIFVDRVLEGYISIKAIRFLQVQNVNIHIQDYSAQIIGSFIPDCMNNGKVKIKQLEAYQKRRAKIAKAILDAKLEAQHKTLLELKNRYNIQTEFHLTGSKLLTIEGNYASNYFEQLGIIFNQLYPEFHFKSRNTGIQRHNANAQDPINSMLNYAYSVIHAITLRYIHSYGLLDVISFLHDLARYKTSLAYDLMELVRPIADLAVIQTLESKKLNWSDFTFSQLKTCRLMPNAQSLLNANLQILINRMIDSKQIETWHKVNISEFAKALENGKAVKFTVKIPRLYDPLDLVEKLENMTVQERKEIGISKTTLWYIQKNLKEGKTVKVYNKTKSKLH